VSKNVIAERAKQQLSTVLLTVLSIVQAIALELIWSYVLEEEDLYTASFESLLGWVQVGATLLGIVLIWLTYSGLVMRFRWVPSTVDSILPFVVGIIEFGVVSMLGLDHLGEWFLVLALAVGVAQWVVQSSMRRARLDEDNAAFFSDFPPATFRDHVPAILVVASLASVGVALVVTRDRGVLALLALIFAVLIHAYQLYLVDYYWKRSVGQAARS